MIDKIQNKIHELMTNQHFDSIAFSMIDFSKNTYTALEYSKGEFSTAPYLFFDLASLTKPLTNSVIRLKYPELFDQKMDLLLNHRAGLPLGGRLSLKDWQEFLWQYQIKESDTTYSDYSSLRTMLEIEKKSGKSLKELCSFYFDEEMVYWNELPEYAITPVTGMREKKIIYREVHDDNCFLLNRFVSHAGLFATIDGISNSLLNLNKEVYLIDQLNNAFKTHDQSIRFIMGFDHPQDLEGTLAGKGCSKNTFGHLGFTGTSFWIDCDKNIGVVLLTNATQNYWYDRTGLNTLRKTLGHMVWEGEFYQIIQKR